MTEQEVAKLIVRLRADTAHYERKMSEAQATAHKFATAYQYSLSKTTKALDSASKSMRTFGMSMSMYVTAPLTLLGGMAIREFGKFDQAMTESTSIMKTTGDQVERMRALALDLARTGIVAPEEIARSYFYLASAGLNAEEAMASLPVVLRFATAGAFDMAKATDLLTDAQSALGLNLGTAAQKAKNMADLADVLTKANILANASVEQFSIALTSKAGSAMKAYGIDMQEGIAVLAAFADQGIKAELAGNAFARLMNMLQKASADNREAWKKYNVTLYNTDGSLRNMADVINDLEKALAGMSAEMKANILDQLGFEPLLRGIILPLIGTSDAIRRYEANLRRAGGTTEEVANKQLKALNNQLKIAWNNIKVTGIELGETLAPYALKLVVALQSLVDQWGRFDSGTQTALIAVGAMLASIGPLFIGLAGLVKVISMCTAAWAAFTAGTTTAVIAVNAVWFVAAIAAAYALGKAIHSVLPSVRAYNEAMEKMGQRHAQHLGGMSESKGFYIGQIDKAEGKDNKLAATAEGIDWAKNRVKAYNREVAEAQKIIDEMNEGWWATSEEIEANEQRMRQAKERRTEAEKILNDLVQIRTDLETEEARAAAQASIEYMQQVEEAQKDAEELTKSLQDQLDTFGMTSREAELYVLSMKGASEEDLKAARNLDKLITQREKHAEAMAKGKALMEQYLTPQEKLMQTETELARLRDMGAIDQDTYTRASNAAQEEFDRAMKELDKLKDKAEIKLRVTPDNMAIRAGTAEFYRMMDALKPQSLQTLGSDQWGEGHASTRTADNTEEMVELMREQAARETSDLDSIAQANFFGGN